MNYIYIYDIAQQIVKITSGKFEAFGTPLQNAGESPLQSATFHKPEGT